MQITSSLLGPFHIRQISMLGLFTLQAFNPGRAQPGANSIPAPGWNLIFQPRVQPSVVSHLALANLPSFQPGASSTRSSARTIHTVHAATRGECFAAAAHAHLRMINPRMRCICIETRDRKRPERTCHACQHNMAPSSVPAGSNTSFCLFLLLLGH